MRFPRRCGVILHPTSLPGPHGCGDFGADAYRFVDWLAEAGQSLWQILPLGGVGAGNSPYMSSSAFAGNVLLIDLAALQRAGWLTADELAAPAPFDEARVDFARVPAWRMSRLEKAAARFDASASPVARAGFARFCEAQRDWLDDYALFMALCDDRPGVEWNRWETDLVRRKTQALASAVARYAERISFWKFCQWNFFSQWAALRAHAQLRGIGIVGDAPIFIAYQSAEVWANQTLFELDSTGAPTVVAGVPPDVFSRTGQLWGNPLYRWSAHARDGYAWWIERIRRTLELVDIVRIDHFRGFAAHWEIRAGQPTAVDGRWVPGPGRALFKAIHEALGEVPIIAEDLGLITPDVEALRREFSLPGMSVLQFAFGGGSDNPYLPHTHRPDSVVYPGTHDNDTTLGWWASADPTVREHASAYLACKGNATSIHWDLLRAASASVADTAIASLQDVLGLGSESRMNFPGRPDDNWAWRFGWSQIEAEVAPRLAAIADLYGRRPAVVSDDANCEPRKPAVLTELRS